MKRKSRPQRHLRPQTALAVYSPRVLAAQQADGFDALTVAQHELALAIDQSRRAEQAESLGRLLRAQLANEQAAARHARAREIQLEAAIEQVEAVAE